jgi:hypothetical protein
MMDGAQRDAVHHGRRSERRAIVNDVRRLQQRRLAKATDGASGRVGAQNRSAESMLMKPDKRLACGVPTNVFSRDEPSGRRIRNGQACLQLDEILGVIDGDDEHGRDRGVLAGCDTAEVDHRHRELVRRDERSVVCSRSQTGAGVWGRGFLKR